MIDPQTPLMFMDGSNTARLNPVQQAVMDHGLLDSGFSVVLQMPTGSGKTWLARQGVARVVERGRRAIYLTPLRASAEELTVQWRQEFSGIPTGIFTGDYGGGGADYPVSYEDARVLIMTPERLDSCLRSWRSHWSWIPEVDLIVLDELHLLADRGRGPRLEGTISRFRRLNPFVRFLGLSATMGNREELADWLEGVEYQSDWRPVPLTWRIARYRKADQKPTLLAEEVASTVQSGGQTIVFVQSRRRSESLARFLRDRGIAAAHHHAGLSIEERRDTEGDFRSGQTRALVATGTLEMGLNLPARQVILYDLQAFDGEAFSALAVNTVWQRAGRAGRFGLDTRGEALLFAAAWDRDADRYARGQFEKISSGLTDEAALAEQILIESQSGLARSRIQMERALAGSLASFQRKNLPVATTIATMIEAGMLREEAPTTGNHKEARIKATPLGRIAVRHLLRPSSVLQLRAFLESFQDFTAFDALLCCALTPDCEPVLAVDFEDLESLADTLAWHSSAIFSCAAPLRHPVTGIPGKRLLSALKTAACLLRFTESGDAESVALEDNCYPFEIHRLRESCDRLLLAAISIQRLIDRGPDENATPDEPVVRSPQLRRLELVRQMILTGLDETSAALTEVAGIGARWAQKLTSNGFSSLALLAAATPEQLTMLKGVSHARASTWITMAATLPTLPIPKARRLRLTPVETDCPVDPYRLRRALELKCLQSGQDSWTVTGGLEPHQVTNNGSPHCDCPDHAKGHTCKHILAVQLASGDPTLTKAIQFLSNHPPHDYLDLFQLWFSH
jgi:helicase